MLLVTSENWTKYGQVQEAFYGDPKVQALMSRGREDRDLADLRRADARPLSLPRNGRVVRWAARPAIYPSPLVQLRAGPGGDQLAPVLTVLR